MKRMGEKNNTFLNYWFIYSIIKELSFLHKNDFCHVLKTASSGR